MTAANVSDKLMNAVTPESHERDGVADGGELTTAEPSNVKQEWTSRGRWSWLTVVTGWRTYARQSVVFAGVSLALLYMTVLGFDSITIGQLSTVHV